MVLCCCVAVLLCCCVVFILFLYDFYQIFIILIITTMIIIIILINISQVGPHFSNVSSFFNFDVFPDHWRVAGNSNDLLRRDMGISPPQTTNRQMTRSSRKLLKLASFECNFPYFLHGFLIIRYKNQIRNNDFWSKFAKLDIFYIGFLIYFINFEGILAYVNQLKWGQCLAPSWPQGQT